MQINSDVATSGSHTLTQRFLNTRHHSEGICSPLVNEDFSVQPIVDVSPPKWHLAHSTWFFEAFILEVHDAEYQTYSPDFSYLFNSYYNNVGERVLRPNRGLMTRPTVEEINNYRSYVTDALVQLLSASDDEEVFRLVEIGINHEQQHQELLIYDIKYILGHQPSFPHFSFARGIRNEDEDLRFIIQDEGIFSVGHQGNTFCYDNELASHKVYLQPFGIANRLITNGEYLDFISDGGYRDFNLWHADGWDYINNLGIGAPLYWHQIDGVWFHYNFHGLEEIDLLDPVMHVSYYEAFAFAEWFGKRLPTEFEWEAAAHLFKWGQLWEWTGSAYLPYPGFKKAPGALGEYNGKFMVNQHVLRGASIATPVGHSRTTYRNFFHPSKRWIYSGIRLAQTQ